MKKYAWMLMLPILSICAIGYASNNEPEQIPVPVPDYLERVNSLLVTIQYGADEPSAESLEQAKASIDSLYIIAVPKAFKASHAILLRSMKDYRSGIILHERALKEGDASLLAEAQLQIEQARSADEEYRMQVTLDYGGAEQ